MRNATKGPQRMGGKFGQHIPKKWLIIQDIVIGLPVEQTFLDCRPEPEQALNRLALALP